MSATLKYNLFSLLSLFYQNLLINLRISGVRQAVVTLTVGISI